MRIDKIDAQERVKTLQSFMMKKFNQRLRDTLLRFFITFSNFEAIFGSQSDLLSCNQFDNMDYSFANIAFDFFVDRYITNGEVNSKFKDTLWRNGYSNDKVAPKVESILKDCKASGPDKLEALYRIAYRFRDNLLHGNAGKEIDRLPEYECCFCKINDFMFQLMKHLIHNVDI